METCLKIYNDNVSIKVGTKKENGNVYFLAECKDEFSFIQTDSVIKRIRRFFSNELFKPYVFYQ